jgi:hypothetical protein
MVIRCPVHKIDLVTHGKGHWCPEGHAVYSIDMLEVLRECAGVLGGSSGRGAYSGTADATAGGNDAPA